MEALKLKRLLLNTNKSEIKNSQKRENFKNCRKKNSQKKPEQNFDFFSIFGDDVSTTPPSRSNREI